MDIWSERKRSEVMSRIRDRDTKPERTVRRILTDMGYRYRLSVKSLPGKPDIVLKKHNAIIFVHGCFWHLCPNCREGRIPASRRDYWEEKLLNNKRRDQRNIRKLRRQGWKVMRLWECEIEKDLDKVSRKIKIFLSN